MTGTLFTDYKRISAGISNMRASYIPSFQGLQQIDYTPDSQKKVKSGWSQIAKGVIGPFAPKHSAFHKHLYDSRKQKIRYERTKHRPHLTSNLNHQRVASNSTADISGIPTQINSKRVNFSMDSGIVQRKKKPTQGPKIGKYDNLMESLNRLKQSTSQSMQMLQTIKDRLERSVEKKRKNVHQKKQKPVKIVIGPDGPICPIDQNLLLRAEIKRWREAKEAKRQERLKRQLMPLDRKPKKIKRFRSATLLGKRDKTKKQEISSPPVSKSHGSFKPQKEEDRPKQKEARINETNTRIKNLQKAYKDTREQAGTHPSSPHATSEAPTFISERGARLSGAVSIKSQHFVTAPSQLPGNSKNNRSYTPNYRKSRRLLGIYQISIINMMKKTSSKKVNVGGEEEKRRKLREQAYNLAPLRSHISIPDSKRLNALNSLLNTSTETPKEAGTLRPNKRIQEARKLRVSFPSLDKLNEDIKK